MKIVIVEDEIRTRNGLINEIKKLGEKYEIAGTAKDGLSGLEIIEKYLPDLIITDIKMPRMDGLEMLYKLKEKGIKHKTIILSGYAEFEYAKQAIDLAVNEYLLKPLTIDILKKSLEKIDNEIQKEKHSLITNIPDIEKILKNLITGKIEKNEALSNLNNYYNFILKRHMVIVNLYFLKKYMKNKKEIINIMISNLQKYKKSEIFIIEPDNKNQIFLMFPTEENFNLTIEYFTQLILKRLKENKIDEYILAIEEIFDFEEIDKVLIRLKNDIKNSFFIQNDSIIYSSYKMNKFESAIYPEYIEKSTVASLYTGSFDKIKICINDFLSYWRENGNTSEPINDYYIRFITSVVNTIRITDMELYENLNVSQIIKDIMNSATFFEIKEIFDRLINLIEKSLYKTEKFYSFSIKKTLSYIHVNYMKDIDLREISEELNITAFYLSKLFYKEVGKHYPQYIKEYRINKAKDLLMNSELNVNEIAQKVGFLNTKYFFRIFKDITGYSPGDYKNFFNS